MNNKEYDKLYAVVSLWVTEDDASCHIDGIFANKESAKFILRKLKFSAKRTNEWMKRYYSAEIVELHKHHTEEFEYFDEHDLFFILAAEAHAKQNAEYFKNKGELENE